MCIKTRLGPHEIRTIDNQQNSCDGTERVPHIEISVTSYQIVGSHFPVL